MYVVDFSGRRQLIWVTKIAIEADFFENEFTLLDLRNPTER